MLQRKITRKLTLLVSAFFIFLMGLVFAAQFFVISRTYMTTEATKLHTNTLTLEALYFEEDHTTEIHGKDFESMREPLERIAKEYDAFCFILDGKSCDIVISSDNAAQMKHSYVAPMQRFIKKLSLNGAIHRPCIQNTGLSGASHTICRHLLPFISGSERSHDIRALLPCLYY